MSARAHNYYLRQKSRINARNAQWKATNRTRVKQKGAELYQSRKVQISVKHKAWRDANKPSISARGKRWKAANPHKLLQYVHKRRTLQAANTPAGEHFTAKQFTELCERYGGTCLRCKQSLPLTADHVIPLVHGGSNAIENIQPLCLACNLAKAMRSTDYRLNQRGN